MQYDAYQNKIGRIAGVLKKIFRHMTKIIIALSVIAVGTAATLAAKGVVLSFEVSDEVIYGDEPAAEANAFLGKVSFEYSKDGSEWAEDMLFLPGEYRARAVSKSTFGSPRYSKEQTFCVTKRTIDVSANESSIVYGDMPSVKANTVYGDVISCDSFDFYDYKIVSYKISGAKVMPSLSEITVTDTEGNDVTWAYKINPVEKDVLIEPRKLEIVVSDKSMIYNGTKLSFNGYEIRKGELVNGDILQAIVDDFIEDAGKIENTPEFVISNENGENVTYCYDLDITYGTLTVDKRPLMIKTESGTFMYNTKAYTARGYELDPQSTLVEGHSLSLVTSTMITDVGEADNYMTFRVLDESGERKTDNYSVFLIMGKLTVTPRRVIVTTASGSFTYDGNEHSFGSVKCEYPDGRINTHTHRTFPFSAKDCGEYLNVTTIEMCDTSGKDVTKNYEITYKYGKIKINKRRVTVKPLGGTFTYDGMPHTVREYECVESVFCNSHKLHVVSSPEITDVGTVTNEFYEYYVVLTTASEEPAEEDYINLDNYEITMLEGEPIEITPRPITVAPIDAIRMYDDTYHTTELIRIVDGEVVKGQYTRSTVSGSQRYVGAAVAEITEFGVYADSEEQGITNVTHNYDITFEKGEIVVYQRPITVTPVYAEKIYDGTVLYPSEVTVWEKSEFGIVGEQRIVSAKLSGSRTNAGGGETWASDVVIYDENDVDRTYCYDISYKSGEIYVIPRPIVIIPVRRYKTYDGTPLMANSWAYSPQSEYRLLDGDSITDVVYIGEQTDAGEGFSGISEATVRDKRGKVSNNYALTYEQGILVVYKRQIAIRPTFAEKVYDGSTEIRVLLNVEDDALVQGHICYAVLNTSSPNAQKTKYYVKMYYNDIFIVDGDGKSANHNYDIIGGLGTSVAIKINQRPITVKPVDARKEYDGLTLYPTMVETSKDSPYTIVPGNTFEFKLNGSQREVGRSESSIEYIYVYRSDDFGKDDYNNTSNYDITIEKGYLEVFNKNDNPGSEGGSQGGGQSSSGVIPGAIGSGKIALPDMKDYNATKDIVAYVIKGEKDGRVYLRYKSFGDYGGSQWGAAVEYDRLIGEKYSASYLASAAFANLLPSYRLEIKARQSYYVLPYYLDMEADGDYYVQRSDVLYEGVLLDPYTVYYTELPSDLSLVGLDGEQLIYEYAYREFVYQNYTEIDAQTLAYMQRLIEENGFYGNDMATILSVAHFIQNSAVYSLDYDRALDKEANIAIAFLESYKEGICQHYATAATLMYRAMGIPARYTVGYVGDTVAGEWTDVTMAMAHAWVEVYIDGVGWIQVEVTGSDPSGGNGGGSLSGEDNHIFITPEYQYKKYDSKPLVANGVLAGNQLFNTLINEKNYTYTVTVTGERTEIGISESKIESFRLFDENGVDVTDKFIIDFGTGVLEVVPENITVIDVFLYQLQKYYDGTPLRYEEEDYIILGDYEGLNIEFSLNVSLTERGYLSLSELNTFAGLYVDFKVTNAEGYDITDYCKVVFRSAGNGHPITVDARALEITTGSAEKNYDGEPLKSDKCYVTKGSLLEGHSIEIEYAEGITEVGQTYNEIVTLTIVDKDGADVTANYYIDVIYGTLTVLPAE